MVVTQIDINSKQAFGNNPWGIKQASMKEKILYLSFSRFIKILAMYVNMFSFLRVKMMMLGQIILTVTVNILTPIH